jgi:hypothetical protein
VQRLFEEGLSAEAVNRAGGKALPPHHLTAFGSHADRSLRRSLNGNESFSIIHYSCDAPARRVSASSNVGCIESGEGSSPIGWPVVISLRFGSFAPRPIPLNSEDSQ